MIDLVIKQNYGSADGILQDLISPYWLSVPNSISAKPILWSWRCQISIPLCGIGRRAPESWLREMEWMEDVLLPLEQVRLLVEVGVCMEALEMVSVSSASMGRFDLLTLLEKGETAHAFMHRRWSFTAHRL